MSFRKLASPLAAALAVSVALAPAWAEDLPATKLTVIGSTNNSNMYKLLEQPLWTTKIETDSDGKVTADLTSLTESGLKGPEIVRLLSTGALDLAHGVFGSVAADDPAFEGLDLAGLVPDIETLHEMSEAYKPVIDGIFEKHGIKLLALLPYPEQAFFCRVPVNSLDDLKGKKVRVYSRSISEFVEAVGGTPVTIPFVDVVPSLQTGTADCAITGTASGNGAKWYEVTSHLYTLSVGSALSFYAANADFWNGLDPSLKTFLEGELSDFEAKVWSLAKEETQDGINCNTGTGECKYGTKASMTLAAPSEADLARAKEIAVDVVLPSWASRCGEACVAKWNETVGKTLGVTAK